MLAQNIKVADFVITEALLSSCSHASNGYNMYLMEKKEEKEKTEKGTKRKALEEDPIAAKKEKLELERVSKKLLDTADKKAKDAEKEERCNCDEGFVNRIKCFQGKSRPNPKDRYSSPGQRNNEDRREN